MDQAELVKKLFDNDIVPAFQKVNLLKAIEKMKEEARE